MRRGVYAARPLPAGTVLQASDLKIVRPALGMPPQSFAELLGRRLGQAVDADEPIVPARLRATTERRRSGS
jgi:N-acetylneuraminate synthase